MTIENLEYIIEIAACKSISKASKNLFISQPRLSQVLRAMEGEVGYEIFQRTSTGIAITQRGQDFVRSAQSVVHEYRKMRTIGDTAADDGRLAVCMVNSSLLSQAFFQWRKENPPAGAVQDDLRENPSPTGVMQDVANNQCRLGLFYVSDRQIERHEMYAQEHGLVLQVVADHLPITLAAPVGHELERAQSRTLKDALRYPFVTYGDIDYDTMLGALGFSRDMDILYVSCRATYYDAIRVGRYISVSLQFAPGEAERNGIVCLPLTGEARYYVMVCATQSGYRPSPREQGYLDFTRAFMEPFRRD